MKMREMREIREEKREKLMIKIKNLLDLANNNPSENEAISAALKAQELMAKYEIQEEELCEKQEKELWHAENINEKQGGNTKWKAVLASIIAKNFCCKVYANNRGSVKTRVFYGYKEDAEIALQVYNFLVEVANKLSSKLYREYKSKHGTGAGIKNTYLLGFCEGVKEALSKQSTALMIVTSPEVEKGFEQFSEKEGMTNKKIQIKKRNDKKIYDTGKRDGRNMAESRYVEA